ncbi:hypothetical protein HDU76_003365 [Blyttiomyces sp. JEL0837]|nr:hypothetical protein HDU76_003365 [Blyttiomyces sp. JEL0837]
MTIFGMLSSMSRHPFDELFATIAMVLYLRALVDVEDMFHGATSGSTETKFSPEALRAVRWVTYFSWSEITVAWYLPRTHMTSFQVGEVLICAGEIMAKIVVMLILVNNTLEEAQGEKVAMLESITNKLEEEMAHSDRLLEKMIPTGVLEQLKSGKAADAQEYPNVTVFFSDIANFTVISSRTSTKDMIATLNKMWVEYDAISKKYGMYKVETIGDAFLGVVGAPDRCADHAERAAEFSLDIISMIKDFRTVTNESIQIRAGLCSGPVTGGILGDSNPHWCIVGDTVNIASKMEATSRKMEVHIAETTYNMLKDTGKYNLTAGDSITIKGKEIKTFFLAGRK